MASEARLGTSLGFRVHKVKARDWEDPIAQAAAICAAIPKEMKVWSSGHSRALHRPDQRTRKIP